MRPARLRHIRLPARAPDYISYSHAVAIQEVIRRRLLAHKDSPSGPAPAPAPTLLSFTPAPTYTLGRRLPRPSAGSLASLRAPLTTLGRTYAPAVHASPRGGLATYHGPGQAVLWPVLDLRASGLSVRGHAALLERATAAALRRAFALDTAADPRNPGVWAGPRKIAALGVHLRRHVSALGVAVNLLDAVYDPGADRGRGREGGAGEKEDEEAGVLARSNPWARIVPCGLEGLAAHPTAVVHEVRARRRAGAVGGEKGSIDVDELGPGSLGRFADVWASELARGLGLVEADGEGAVDLVGEEEVAELEKGVVRGCAGCEVTDVLVG